MSKLLRDARLGPKKKEIVDFTSSLEADQELFENVVRINRAHVVMMAETGIIDAKKASALIEALRRVEPIRDLAEADTEDIHMYVEESVLKSAGPEVGGDLHIGKSRNDQVSTAIRMTLREYLIRIASTLIQFQEKLLDAAQKHVETMIPGYTHTQPAQPITFAHYLLSFFDASSRDIERLTESYRRVNKSPMGAGALAGTSFPINRERTAELLGFDGLVENSLDAVGSRDFAVEVQAALTLAALNLSRLVEDLILWSSPQFKIIELPDEFTSTSSIMPQKKNPEVPEVIRARVGDIAANLVATVITLKSLPSGYNMDLQEITPKLWKSANSLISSLSMLSSLIPNVKVTKEIPIALLDFTTSTELANMLLRKSGVSFRSAHRIVGSLVRELIEKGLSLSDATPDMIKATSSRIVGYPVKITEADIHSSVDPKKFIESHNVKGAPSPAEVARMLEARKRELAAWKAKVSNEANRLRETWENLQSVEEPYLKSGG